MSARYEGVVDTLVW